MDAVLSPAVIDAARRRQRRRRLSAVTAVVVAAAAIVLVTAPWRGSPPGSSRASASRAQGQSSQASGPWEVVAQGTDWNLVVKPGKPGRLCFSYGAPGQAANGCVLAPRTALSSPLVMAGRHPDRERIVGLVSDDVTRVSLQLSGGRIVSTAVRALHLAFGITPPFEVYALDFRFARRSLTRSTLVAYGLRGKVLARKKL